MGTHSGRNFDMRLRFGASQCFVAGVLGVMCCCGLAGRSDLASLRETLGTLVSERSVGFRASGVDALASVGNERCSCLALPLVSKVLIGVVGSLSTLRAPLDEGCTG